MSKEFNEAAASYFGIDPARLADSTLTSNAEGLTLHLKIRLTDDDMIATGKRMEERRKPVGEVVEWKHNEDRAVFYLNKSSGRMSSSDGRIFYQDDAGTFKGPDGRMYREEGDEAISRGTRIVP